MKAYIDKERCIACGICVDICPKDAIDVDPKDTHAYKGFIINHETCTGCKKCECDENAINYK